ncbi:heavy metal-binding domain-containing protein [Parasediminibacterium sp. JCM 36343]|uniref:heavy metal-binding domain-containing protein n=1 Tax=Parasediminibacterium sp. JCM 36343 TaxID=3374279 RepID=UPI00397B8C78
MKKLLLVLTLSFATVVSFSQTMQDSTAKKTKTATKKYTCPMHPKVIADKPGKCPICGMTLVLVKTKAATGMKM